MSRLEEALQDLIHDNSGKRGVEVTKGEMRAIKEPIFDEVLEIIEKEPIVMFAVDTPVVSKESLISKLKAKREE